MHYATEQGRFLEFHDEYANTSDGWRFVSRVVRPVLQPEIWPCPLRVRAQADPVHDPSPGHRVGAGARSGRPVMRPPAPFSTPDN
ncbi:hypothetical protein [Pseudonocardia xishanensis]|uniref:SnoaL-like protein n=1 Tax=Pseudonocardia xishanensis TaxID=630995 RepID=A0ABP8RWX0_9PSEU